MHRGKILELDTELTAALGFPMFKRHRTPVATGRAAPLEKIRKLRGYFKSGISRAAAMKQCGLTWQTVDRYYEFWGGDVPKRKVTPSRRTPWLPSEKKLLRQLYPMATKAEVVIALPRHPWLSICKMATSLKVNRQIGKVTSSIEVIRDLRAARERRAMTRKQLAHKLGVHPQFITNWERGINAPRFRNLLKWCAALGVVLRIYDSASLSVTPVTGRINPPSRLAA